MVEVSRRGGVVRLSAKEASEEAVGSALSDLGRLVNERLNALVKKMPYRGFEEVEAH